MDNTVDKKSTTITKGIIFVDKQSIYLFFEKAKGVYRLDLKPEMVYDLEIVNEDLLSQALSTFLTTNSIPSLSAIIIASPAILFVKDFSKFKDNKEVPHDEYENEIKQFVENVPFEDPIEKRFEVTKTSEKIVVMNSNFLETIKKIFSQNKITILSYHIPFEKGLEMFANGYSDSGMHNALGKFHSLKSTLEATPENKKIEPEDEKDYQEIETKPSQSKITSKTIMLITVLGFLLLVLIGVAYKTFVLDVKKAKTPAVTIPAQQETIIISPTAALVPSLPPGAKQAFSIQILNGTGSTQGITKISSSLQTSGFTKITSDTTAPSQNSKNRIVLKTTVNPIIKNELLALLTDLYPDIVTLETNELSNDAVITVYSIEPKNQKEQINNQVQTDGENAP